MKFRDITPFNVRFPTELKNKLKAAASKKTGSINAEVIERITASFERSNDLKDFSDGELIDELIHRWGREKVYIRLGDPEQEK